jgi:tetratricopeptide (TPR) repeat protein
LKRILRKKGNNYPFIFAFPKYLFIFHAQLSLPVILVVKKVLTPRVSRKAHPIFLWALLFLASPVLGQSEKELFGSGLSQIYLEIRSLKLQSANQKLTDFPQKGPAWAYLSHLSMVVELMVTEDPDLYAEFDNAHKQHLKMVESLPASTPWKGFLSSDMKLQRAFVKLKFGEDFSAGVQLRTAYLALKKNQLSFPNFLPQNKSFGLMQVMLGSVPEKYGWILKLLGMQGSISEGMHRLENLSISESIFAYEATLMLGMIEAYMLEQAANGITNLQNQLKSHPDDLLSRYILISILMKNHQSQEALIWLEKPIEAKGYLNFHFLNYLRAEANLQKGNYAQAKSLYQQFLENYKGRNFVRDAWYKLGLCFWLIDDKATSEKYFTQARVLGFSNSEADKNAEASLKIIQNANPAIMAARLAMDGGFFDKAEKGLYSIKTSELNGLRENVELAYRKGRLAQLQSKTEQAVSYFLKCIEMAGKEPWYYAPNAAYNMGKLYAAQGDKAKAKQYFELCLSYKNHEYKNSLDNKALTGLEKLN